MRQRHLPLLPMPGTGPDWPKPAVDQRSGTFGPGISSCATVANLRMPNTGTPDCGAKASADRRVMRANSLSGPTAGGTKPLRPRDSPKFGDGGGQDVQHRQPFGAADRDVR